LVKPCGLGRIDIIVKLTVFLPLKRWCGSTTKDNGGPIPPNDGDDAPSAVPRTCLGLCPISKGRSDRRLARFEAATWVAAKLIEQQLVVFSPVTMTHPIDRILAREGGTLGSAYWLKFDLSFLEVCAELFVLMLPGWKESSGVRREIGFFESRGLPIRYLNSKDYGISPANPAFHAAFGH
jgi:hypothetical protein